jgi:hypothetical protein
MKCRVRESRLISINEDEGKSIGAGVSAVYQSIALKSSIRLATEFLPTRMQVGTRLPSTWKLARPLNTSAFPIFVSIADRDYSVARPHWASHPLPFLDDLPVGLKDALADAGERFATPVCKSCYELVN